MKYLIIALALMPYPSLAATCYSSDDCNRIREQQIKESHDQQMREREEWNERIREEENMRQMIKDEQYNSKGWSN